MAFLFSTILGEGFGFSGSAPFVSLFPDARLQAFPLEMIIYIDFGNF